MIPSRGNKTSLSRVPRDNVSERRLMRSKSENRKRMYLDIKTVMLSEKKERRKDGHAMLDASIFARLKSRYRRILLGVE